MRASIAPTYDSRETGPRFSVTSRVDGRTISVTSMPDPFMTHRVTVGWRDLLRGLLRRRRLEVVVMVDAPPDLVEDVLELDENYTGQPGSARRAEWDAQVGRALRDLGSS